MHCLVLPLRQGDEHAPPKASSAAEVTGIRPRSSGSQLYRSDGGCLQTFHRIGSRAGVHHGAAFFT